jgi:hypothetical protein
MQILRKTSGYKIAFDKQIHLSAIYIISCHYQNICKFIVIRIRFCNIQKYLYLQYIDNKKYRLIIFISEALINKTFYNFYFKSN